MTIENHIKEKSGHVELKGYKFLLLMFLIKIFQIKSVTNWKPSKYLEKKV